MVAPTAAAAFAAAGPATAAGTAAAAADQLQQPEQQQQLQISQPGHLQTLLQEQWLMDLHMTMRTRFEAARSSYL